MILLLCWVFCNGWFFFIKFCLFSFNIVFISFRLSNATLLVCSIFTRCWICIVIFLSFGFPRVAYILITFIIKKENYIRAHILNDFLNLINSWVMLFFIKNNFCGIRLFVFMYVIYFFTLIWFLQTSWLKRVFI